MEEQDCDASNGGLGDPNSLYEGNIQVPLDVLIRLFPVDNRANLERFTLDLAALLFILICFEVNVLVDMRWCILDEYAQGTTAHDAKSEKLRWCTHSFIAHRPPADRPVAFKLLGFLPFLWASCAREKTEMLLPWKFLPEEAL
ncbi:hypothetical protein WN943_005840 [Citrus x changshan-huyou]